jgi:hypothetical protein
MQKQIDWPLLKSRWRRMLLFQSNQMLLRWSKTYIWRDVLFVWIFWQPRGLCYLCFMRREFSYILLVTSIWRYFRNVSVQLEMLKLQVLWVLRQGYKWRSPYVLWYMWQTLPLFLLTARNQKYPWAMEMRLLF